MAALVGLSRSLVGWLAGAGVLAGMPQTAGAQPARPQDAARTARLVVVTRSPTQSIRVELVGRQGLVAGQPTTVTSGTVELTFPLGALTRGSTVLVAEQVCAGVSSLRLAPKGTTLSEAGGGCQMTMLEGSLTWGWRLGTINLISHQLLADDTPRVVTLKIAERPQETVRQIRVIGKAGTVSGQLDPAGARVTFPFELLSRHDEIVARQEICPTVRGLAILLATKATPMPAAPGCQVTPLAGSVSWNWSLGTINLLAMTLVAEAAAGAGRRSGSSSSLLTRLHPSFAIGIGVQGTDFAQQACDKFAKDLSGVTQDCTDTGRAAGFQIGGDLKVLHINRTVNIFGGAGYQFGRTIGYVATATNGSQSLVNRADSQISYFYARVGPQFTLKAGPRTIALWTFYQVEHWSSDATYADQSTGGSQPQAHQTSSHDSGWAFGAFGVSAFVPLDKKKMGVAIEFVHVSYASAFAAVNPARAPQNVSSTVLSILFRIKLQSLFPSSKMVDRAAVGPAGARR